MGARLIRVSTRRTGERKTVRVWIYDTVGELRAAANRFHPSPDGFEDAEGVCQTYVTELINGSGQILDRHEPIIVRLHRDALGVGVVTHELNHAATHIYGSTLDPDTLAVDVLHVANETLAHLQSDLTRSLIRQLWAHGYYA